MKKAFIFAAAIFASLQLNIICAAEETASAPKSAAANLAATAATGGSTFDIGDAKVAFPSPASAYVEMPTAMRTGMEATLPPTNRLLCGFVKSSDPTGNSTISALSIRPMEAAKLGDADFKMFVDQTKAALNGASVEKALKEIDATKDLVSGQPKMLGTLLERDDLFVTAMLLSANTPNGTINIAVGSGMMRVHQKLIALSITAPYKDEDTIKSMKSELDAWASAIAAANQ